MWCVCLYYKLYTYTVFWNDNIVLNLLFTSMLKLVIKYVSSSSSSPSLVAFQGPLLEIGLPFHVSSVTVLRNLVPDFTNELFDIIQSAPTGACLIGTKSSLNNAPRPPGMSYPATWPTQLHFMDAILFTLVTLVLFRISTYGTRSLRLTPNISLSIDLCVTLN